MLLVLGRLREGNGFPGSACHHSLQPPISLGGFEPPPPVSSYLIDSNCDISLREGEISGVLAALENLCARLFFLPTEEDLPSLLLPTGYEGGDKRRAPLLSSISVNVHGSVGLIGLDGLLIGGLVSPEQQAVEALPVWTAGGDRIFLTNLRSPDEAEHNSEVIVMQVSVCPLSCHQK